MVAERDIPAKQWTRTRSFEAFAFSVGNKRKQKPLISALKDAENEKNLFNLPGIRRQK